MYEIKKLYLILESFLGESKSGYYEKEYQYQFPCPRCIEKYGSADALKYNLEVNIKRGVFQCWKCSSEGEEMHGSIYRLIKMYGNDTILRDYKSTIASLRESELYKLHFSKDDFAEEKDFSLGGSEISFPPSFKLIEKDIKGSERPLEYLQKRGVGWDIIESKKIGFTSFQETEKKSSFRVIIPSYDLNGDVNYWVGRDYLGNSKRMKYDNPKVEKKDIIFNELTLQWDDDITLVEGTFEHIVVPNSVPLLGEALNENFKLYWDLLTKANANINIFLDGDAFGTVKEIYKRLNHGSLYGRVRYIQVSGDDDPSSIYQRDGKRGIISHLSTPRKIKEQYLC